MYTTTCYIFQNICVGSTLSENAYNVSYFKIIVFNMFKPRFILLTTEPTFGYFETVISIFSFQFEYIIVLKSSSKEHQM